MLDTWLRTVFGDRFSCRAISGFVRFRARWARISRSRSVSSGKVTARGGRARYSVIRRAIAGPNRASLADLLSRFVDAWPR